MRAPQFPSLPLVALLALSIHNQAAANGTRPVRGFIVQSTEDGAATAVTRQSPTSPTVVPPNPGPGGTIGTIQCPTQKPVVMDTVPVGDPHNPPTAAGNGDVAYGYEIGAFEVTNWQYAQFLRAVASNGDPHALYHIEMSHHVTGGITRSLGGDGYCYRLKPNMAHKPVNFVRYFDVLRFVNWLHNGQPHGSPSPNTTENGAYDLSLPSYDPLSPWTFDEQLYLFVERNPGATWAVPTLDEWYKAAKYNAANQTYTSFATQSFESPTPGGADSAGNLLPGSEVVNYLGQANWNGTTEGNLSTVGTAGPDSTSFYGTHDQNGNVTEWLDHILCLTPNFCGRHTGLGHFATSSAFMLNVFIGPGVGYGPAEVEGGDLYEHETLGFRVVRLQ